jgi:hypothetical protein
MQKAPNIKTKTTKHNDVSFEHKYNTTDNNVVITEHNVKKNHRTIMNWASEEMKTVPESAYTLYEEA